MKKAKIYYFTLTDEQRKEEKLEWFQDTKFNKIPFELIQPSKKNNWINLADNDFEELMPLIDKKNQNTLFEFSSLGVSTNRDEWVYDFDEKSLKDKMKYFVKEYNNLLKKNDKSWKGTIKWSRDLKKKFERKQILELQNDLLVESNYRPFIKKKWYAEKVLNDVFTQNHYDIFGEDLRQENRLITVYSLASSHLLSCLSTNLNFDLAFLKQGNGGVFCLPLYRYTKEGKRIDNITQWALNEFRSHYSVGSQRSASDDSVDSHRRTYQNTEPHDGMAVRELEREDIFHYVYGVLHNPAYRKKYELNLKREFPRIPFYEDFWFWAEKGKELMELHLDYENIEKYELEREEKPLKSGSLNKAKLKADKIKNEIVLDNLTTLKNIPAVAWDYKLGNRSALEWILDQYKEKKPRDTTIREKFNTYKFEDYKEEVIELLQRVCTVSVKTMKIVEEMESK
ncbi:type ISP restriction/modification enzyme [Bernardetia sp. ABR2-2B]|uniref:type ISP restriction/modification enzyme n=1 Tax=Bernardetia sp. ABR2-2B TaxID=3127472 RepID=UPI0030CC727B